MSDKQVFILANPQVRRNAVRAIAEAPNGFKCEIKASSRSSDQNALLHAIFSEVAKKAKWVGRPLTATQWKVLFISGHAQATNRGSDMVPGLEGEFCNIRESSAGMSVARMTSLIEYTLAWCAANGVEVRDYSGNMS